MALKNVVQYVFSLFSESLSTPGVWQSHWKSFTASVRTQTRDFGPCFENGFCSANFAPLELNFAPLELNFAPLDQIWIWKLTREWIFEENWRFCDFFSRPTSFVFHKKSVRGPQRTFLRFIRPLDQLITRFENLKKFGKINKISKNSSASCPGVDNGLTGGEQIDDRRLTSWQTIRTIVVRR